ncbi:hypothetical protein UFOVP1483_33 [uncultured Caudovirales phage]|uniref:Uncharacterized protein n=1 Tax=uncultured Caudovirales phage TaxID=2100421 RepID=A0A6J5SL48_9CAUD|nr:hypothetical protein UFOVP1483_33 [uncultured Caudovirales phage]
MAGVRFSTNFYDENGIEYTVRIYDTTWGGGVTDLDKMPQPGFEISYEGDGDTLFANPIRTSSCKAQIFIRDNSQETFWKGVVNRPEKTLYLVIHRSGALYWQGPILNDLINFDHASYPIPLEVEATDGLGILDGLIFDSTNWGATLPAYSTTAVITGPQLIADVIAKIFPSGVPIYSLHSANDIFTVSDIITHTSIAAGDIFKNTGFLYKQFALETKEAQDGQVYMYYRQVLEEVLKSLGMIIMQVDGYYRLIQVVQRKYASTTIEYVYKIDATEYSNRTYDARVNYPTKGWDAEPVESFAAPVKKIILPAKADNNLIIGGGTGAGLTYEAVSTKFTPLMDVPVLYYDYTSVLSKIYAGGINRKLNLSIDIDIDGTSTYNPVKVALSYVKLMIKNAAGTWYALNNYDSAADTYWNAATQSPNPLAWTATSSPATATKLQYVSYNHLNLLHNTLHFSTPDLPFDVVDTFLLVGFSDFSSFYMDAYMSGTLSFASSVKSKAANYYGSFNQIVVGQIIKEATAPFTDIILAVIAPAKFSFASGYSGISGTKSILFLTPASTIQPTDTTILVMSNSRLEYIDDGSYFANNGVIYTATSNQEARKVWDLSLFNICDFTGGNANQCVKYYDGAAWQNASAWKILAAYATEATHALLYTLVQWMMRFYRKSLRTFNGSLKSSTFQPHLNLIYKSEEYIWCGGTLEASTGKWSGEWVIVSLSDIADTTIGTPVKNYIKDNVKAVKNPWLIDIINKTTNQLGNVGSNVSGVSGALALSVSTLQGNVDAVPVVSYNLSGAPVANARINDINFTLDSATMQWFDGTVWQTGFTALTSTLPNGQIWIGNASNVATGRTLTGDVTVSNTGVTTIGTAKVVDAMLATSYIKADGSRALTGNWAAGAFSATFNSVIVGQAANTIVGGAASAGNLELQATTNATKGYVGLTYSARATANYGSLSIGGGGFGGGAGNFAGNANGTNIAVNTASGYTGNIIDLQVNGVKVFTVDASGFVDSSYVGSVTASQILAFRSSGTERARFLSTGEFIIGATTMSSNGSYFMVQKNQNAATYQSVVNTTSGTAAYAGLFVSGSAALTSAIGTIALSAGYTTAGILVANTGVVFSNMGAGLNIGTSNNTQVSIWTNGVSRLSFSGAGQATFAGSIITAAPTTGTAGAWKFGIRVAATVAHDATQYIQLDIGGTLYKIGIVT